MENMSGKKVKELQKELTEIFREKGFDSPELESTFILEEVLHLPGMEMIFRGEDELSSAQLSQALSFMERRVANEPFQYIFGWTPFRELDLTVGPGVLIPRPETEYILDHVLQHLPRNAKVCELGSGSGAISLSLGKERQDLTIMGSEISEEAFRYSLLNLERAKLTNVQFFRGDLFEPFPAGVCFDALIANLPYIAEEEFDSLPPNVRDYEPATALLAEDGGFALIGKTLRECGTYLSREEAFLWLEMGENHGERALECVRKYNFFQSAELLPDQYGVKRFLFARRHKG